MASILWRDVVKAVWEIVRSMDCNHFGVYFPSKYHLLGVVMYCKRLCCQYLMPNLTSLLKSRIQPANNMLLSSCLLRILYQFSLTQCLRTTYQWGSCRTKGNFTLFSDGIRILVLFFTIKLPFCTKIIPVYPIRAYSKSRTPLTRNKWSEPEGNPKSWQFLSFILQCCYSMSTDDWSRLVTTCLLLFSV